MDGPAPTARRRTARPIFFERFYREHFALAWRGLRRLGVAPGDCEDAAQEVFVAAHRRWSAFDDAVPRQVWLLGIVRRIAWRYRRTDHRRTRRHSAFLQVDVPVPSLDDHLARAEAGRMLADFLDELDHDRREAFVLGELEELGRIELGNLLGINPNTAYSRLQSARRSFFAHFAALDDDACAKLLVAAEREDVPSEASRERGWLALGPIVAGAAGGAPLVVAGITTGLRSAIAVKVGICAIGVATIATVVAARSAEAPPSPPVIAVPQVERAAVPPAAAAVPPIVAAPVRTEPRPLPEAPARATPAPTRKAVPTGLEAELELLDQARIATVAADVAAARRWLAAHRERFGDATELAELRRAIERDLEALSINPRPSGDASSTEER